MVPAAPDAWITALERYGTMSFAEVAAAAPVFVVAAPVTHVANTDANDPYRRVADVHRWIQSNDPAIARRYAASWAIRAGRLYRLPQ